MTQKTVKRIAATAASDNATLVISSRAYVYRVIGYNANAAARYLKLYNKAVAPVVGDTPELTIGLPPGSFNLTIEHRFATGLGYRITTGALDNDTGVTGTDISLNILYS